MKPIWLIETGVWKDENVPRMIAILRELGLTVHSAPFGPFSWAEFNVVDEDGPVIFYGSLNTVEALRFSLRKYVPLIWFDGNVFSCRSYYAHWGKYLLQEHYGFYPLGELPRLKERLYRTYSQNDMLFIRPDDNDKSFAGRLVPEENFRQWYEDIAVNKPDPATLAVVSAPVRLELECRFVIADRKVVASTYYKGRGELALAGDYLGNATPLAEEIAADPWQPRPIYCVDIAYTHDGRYRLLEIGGINSAGLYRCELLPIIRAMNEIAVKDYRHWKGMV